MRKSKDETNIIKSIILFSLLTAILTTGSVVFSSYPQHIAIDNKTTINSEITFKNNNTVNVRGNQVAFTEGVINLERGYIRITANQVQVGDKKLREGIRTITPEYFQNPLFQQRISEFTANQVASINIDNNVVNIIPLTDNVVKISTRNDNYNVVFTQSNAFLTHNDIMLRLQKTGDTISVYVVGLRNYDNITFKVKSL